MVHVQANFTKLKLKQEGLSDLFAEKVTGVFITDICRKTYSLQDKTFQASALFKYYPNLIIFKFSD